MSEVSLPLTIIVNPNAPRCYRVVPSKGGEPYDIELDALGGNGSCDCANFIFRLEHQVQSGSFGLVCRHIAAAKEFDRLKARVQ